MFQSYTRTFINHSARTDGNISDAEDRDPPETNPEKTSCYREETDITLPKQAATGPFLMDQKDIVSRSTMQMIKNAASLDALQECLMRHSTRLQTTVEEKGEIVSDYLQWYIIDRNSSVIDG
ncbi:hypothetical protein PFLUV_G00169900 [Perca fluviatilis]|uniref:Uncharacterized protein n=1 Tax=Perca fluviatilis TaxID=8168 RepID=A0A6A5DZP9_PERFL|nr:hypothetical protein PFLUV_G00169900 [Perca fluviatilis]